MRFFRLPAFRICLAVASGFVLGFAWSATLAHDRLSVALPLAMEGRDITLIGIVDSLPSFNAQGSRFDFRVEQVLEDSLAPPLLKTAIPRRLALSWYARPATGTTLGASGQSPAFSLEPGERWRLTVRLRRPHGNANPYGFDYEAWLLEQDLRATGSVRDDAASTRKNIRLAPFVASPGNMVQRCRSWLRHRIQSALEDRPYAAVMVALVVGDQRDIGQADWEVFNRTGVGHLISISGLHITMVAGVFAALAQMLWRRSFLTRLELPLLLPAQKVAALTGTLTALLYVALAGFAVPAQRTLVMLAVVALALWSGRLASVSHVLCVALMTVLLFDPWASLSPGFWLSFCAVALIVFVSAGRAARPSDAQGDAAPLGEKPSEPLSARLKAVLTGASLTQYAVTVGLVPLSLLLFGQFSLVSPLANAIAIPLVSFLVTPLALAGSLAPAPLSGWMLLAGHSIVGQLASVLSWMASFSMAVWRAPQPGWATFALALAGALWMLAPRGWPSRWLGALAWLPLVLARPAAPAQPGHLWITVFDVGQGTAVLLETARHRLLYDTGPAYSPESDAGNRVILPYLRGRGIEALDTMVVSHSDIDHAGGALSILREVRVAALTSSLDEDSAIARAASSHTRCLAGRRWSWDGVDFEMVFPHPEVYARTKWPPNARSCTLKVTAPGGSVLLPGDLEAAQEAMLVASHGGSLESTVLLAPHHGSGTSSTRAFLETVKPRLTIFQVGYRNRYRHPREDVLARYDGLGMPFMRTDASGAIILRLERQAGQAPAVSAYRRDHARYWYGR